MKSSSCITPFYLVPVLLVLSLWFTLPVQAQTGEQYVKAMHARYKDSWFRTLSFTQETEIYKNDSLLRKSTWYEMARFPFELRIDVDTLNGGNRTVYKKDSTYRIRKNKIQAVTADPNPFIFFLGGMYMLPKDSVMAHLTQNGYDLLLGAVTDWQGRKTLVIGAGNDKDTTRNQFWVDAEHLYIVRVILKSGTALLDVHLSGHVKLRKGWSETLVKFYRDGHLLQVEKYSNLQPDVVLPDAIFDINKFR